MFKRPSKLNIILCCESLTQNDIHNFFCFVFFFLRLSSPLFSLLSRSDYGQVMISRSWINALCPTRVSEASGTLRHLSADTHDMTSTNNRTVKKSERVTLWPKNKLLRLEQKIPNRMSNITYHFA